MKDLGDGEFGLGYSRLTLSMLTEAITEGYSTYACETDGSRMVVIPDCVFKVLNNVQLYTKAS